MSQEFLTDEELKNLLTEVQEMDTAAVAPEHPLHTAECLPLARFADMVKTKFTSAERDHIVGCAYCERMLAITWRLTGCPKMRALRTYRIAAQYHVEEDGCHRCRFLWHAMQALEKVIRPAPEAILGIGRWPVQALAAAQEPQRMQLFQTSGDEGLMVSLRVTDWNELRLWVRSPLHGDRRQSWKVRAALVFKEGDPLTADLALEDKGELGHIGEYSFSKEFSKDCAARMDQPFALAVEWIN